jgi:redox-sensitive bicupin YhaK (pirin superfamily)
MGYTSSVTTHAPTPEVDVRQAQDRFTTRTAWLDSRHSFSFGPHYDAANTSHGLLVVHNDDRVTAGSGFDPHPHRDMEIVTWVVQGSLVHEDSAGNHGVLYPGLAQRMSAGTGIRHSERNDAFRLDPHRPRAPVHFVQMWVVPDEPGGAPGYEQREVDDALRTGALVPVASGRADHDSAIRIRNRHAVLHAARLQPDQGVQLPQAPYLHLSVARGSVALEGCGALRAGDAVRFTASGGQRVTATEPAEVLVWEMHASLAG